MTSKYQGFDPDFAKTSPIASRGSVHVRGKRPAMEEDDEEECTIGMSAQEQHDAGLARAMRRLRARDASVEPSDAAGNRRPCRPDLPLQPSYESLD